MTVRAMHLQLGLSVCLFVPVFQRPAAWNRNAPINTNVNSKTSGRNDKRGMIRSQKTGTELWSGKRFSKRKMKKFRIGRPKMRFGNRNKSKRNRQTHMKKARDNTKRNNKAKMKKARKRNARNKKLRDEKARLKKLRKARNNQLVPLA